MGTGKYSSESPKVCNSSPAGYSHASHSQLPMSTINSSGADFHNGVRPHPPLSHSKDSHKVSPIHKKSKTKPGFMTNHNFNSRAKIAGGLGPVGTNPSNSKPSGHITYYMNDKLPSSTIYLLKSQKLRTHSPVYIKYLYIYIYIFIYIYIYISNTSPKFGISGSNSNGTANNMYLPGASSSREK